MSPKLRMMDGSMESQLKIFGYKSSDHSPHWTFPANDDEKLMKNVYTSFINLGVEIMTTNTYHFGSTLDEKLKVTNEERNKYEQYFKNSCDILCNLTSAKQNVEVLGSVGTMATMYHDMSEYSGVYMDSPDSFTTAVKYFDTIIGLFDEKTKIKKLIFETISNEKEAIAALESLKKFPNMTAIMSFTCGKNSCLRHGENIKNVAQYLSVNNQIAGIGINCTDPDNIAKALLTIKPFNFREILVYPNFGDSHFDINEFGSGKNLTTEMLLEWASNGATGIGGCCGITSIELKNLKNMIDCINK